MDGLQAIEASINAMCEPQRGVIDLGQAMLCSSDGIIIADALLRASGIEKFVSESSIGATTSGQIFHSIPEEVIDLLRTAIAAPRQIEMDRIMPIKKNGQSRWLHIAAKTVEVKGADKPCHVFIVRDIAQQSELVQENHVLQQQTEILQKIGRVDVVELSRETGLIELPENFKEMLQLANQQRGLTLTEAINLIHPEDKQSIEDSVKACISKNEPIDVEFRVEVPDERPRWIRCHSLPSKDDEKGRLPRRWSVQDVTLYKLANLDLLEKLKEANKHLVLANSSLNDFSYALSHDLKRPVRHMKSFAELLEEALQNSDIKAAQGFAKRISEGASEMSELILAMHKFAQLGQHSMNWEWIDHRAVIEDLILRLTTPEVRSRLQVHFQEGMPQAHADVALWRILWGNLIENAIKYSKERACISLCFGFEMKSDGVHFSISDNGIGFAAGQAAVIFQMFRRLSTDGRFDGTGIGLAYAKRIVEAHGGTISATAEPDQGARFSVFIPQAKN